ncbi:hypothetical protein Hanom_Chr06g00560561 [Helianthus anomalus]
MVNSFNLLDWSCLFVKKKLIIYLSHLTLSISLSSYPDLFLYLYLIIKIQSTYTH